MLGSYLLALVKKPKKMSFDGEDDDEEILYLFRRSIITNVDWVLVSALLIITPPIAQAIYLFASQNSSDLIDPGFIFILQAFWYTFTLGYIFQNFINWFFNIYIITNKKILDIDFVGFLFKNISEAPLDSIQDVTSNVSGTLRVVFNYGNVLIQTAAEKTEFEFTDVPKPAVVRDIISDIITKQERVKK